MASKKPTPTETAHEVVVLRRLKNTLRAISRWFQNLFRSVFTYITRLPKKLQTWREQDKKTLRYRSFRLQKRIKPPQKDIPSSWELFKQSLQFLWKHKRVFLGIFTVYVIVYYFVVRAPLQPDVSTIQKAISTAVEGTGTQISGVQNNVVTLSAVLGSTGSTQQNGAVAAAILFCFSLIYVWSLRQLHNNNAIKVRDAFYQGLTTIIPVGIIVGVLLLELLPFAFASFIYTLARTSGIFVTGFEDLAFFTLTILIGLLSFYWMTSGVIAAYMAALPGVYPMYALKSAKKLVQFQRLRVFRRMITLPILIGVIYLICLLLSIRLLPNMTFIIAEVIQLLFVPLVLTYLYKLYRSLL